MIKLIKSLFRKQPLTMDQYLSKQSELCNLLDQQQSKVLSNMIVGGK